jgi:hypothetical protein
MLHRPTFVTNATQNLLLIAIITIGALCIEKTHDHSTMQKSQRLATFLATHMRWETFRGARFRPPAKLWVFQTLLLLEIYEKLYGSCVLHKRGVIHHAATITLMQRGGLPLARSVLDPPPSTDDNNNDSGNRAAAWATQLGNDGSQKASVMAISDSWWQEWMLTEVTRRVTSVAFYIDAVHAQLLVHSAAMVVQEMQLMLPCDEKLWSATSGAELRGMMDVNSIEHIQFLSALKQTLRGQRVRTNAFGRMIIMAGLLNLTWHMKQFDLHLSLIGFTQADDRRLRSYSKMTRAYNFWKKDFDGWLDENLEMSAGAYAWKSIYQLQDDIVFGNRNELHCLAYMALHIGIVDYQNFANAQYSLRCSVTSQEHESTKGNREKWAMTVEARYAAFHALRFLSDVLYSSRPGPLLIPLATVPGKQELGGGGGGYSSVVSGSANPHLSMHHCPTIHQHHPQWSLQQYSMHHVNHCNGHHDHSPASSNVPLSQLPPFPPLPQSQPPQTEQQQQQPQTSYYSARGDHMINRPWVLCYAALTVWSYGYALEGILPPELAAIPVSLEEAQRDMTEFLLRVGGVSSPEAPENLRGSNRCVGMLIVVRNMLRMTGWELLQEAAKLLEKCINLLLGNFGRGPATELEMRGVRK